ncbi:MAG: hypothetical protein P4L42_04980 [Desulfocapsaceae bacterium]|nr:hypothetical protein [Desulfocapsaceae bacterium]
MAGKEKKMAAALAAVNAYIQEEEAIAAAQMAMTVAPTNPGTQFTAWGMSGRHDMMSLRRLIQMRAFDRLR